MAAAIGGPEDRNRDPHTVNGGRHQMGDQGDAGDREQARAPKPVLREEMERQQRGNDRPAHIDGNHGARPVHHDGHDVAHPEIAHLASRQNVLLGKLGDRDVDVASEQGGEEEEERRVRAHAETRIGIAQNAELNENEKNREDADKKREEERRYRQVLQMTCVHGKPFASSPQRI